MTLAPASEYLSGTIIRFSTRGQEVSFFVTDPADLIQSEHTEGRFYEAEELEIIGRYFYGGCFVDIGANIGNHAVYISRFLNPSRIICIEPNPEAIRIFDVNIKLNEISHIVDRQHLGIGLAAAEGMAALHQPQIDNMGAMQLIPGSGDIRVTTGDTLLAREHPAFIKVDVEGMELEVLQGLQHTIARCSPTIFVEVDNVNREPFANWRRSCGYEIVEGYRRYPQNENFLLIPTR
jgi:FkbM family methyltransferase